MLVQGLYHKIGNQWIAEIPLLYTVIGSPPGADRESLAGNIKNLAQQSNVEISLVEEPLGHRDKNSFFFKVKNVDQFLPMILKRTRLAKKLSIGDVTKRLGYSSRNSYAQYEYGKTKLTFTKYIELIDAMDPSLEVVLSTLQ